jgi:3-oxoacyl-[acyl-carrier protein] reductase
MFSLEGKKVLVTGASRGIGAAIFKTLEKMGADVIGTATTIENAEKIPHNKGKVLNVADVDSIENVVNQIGHIDILVNNAALTRDNLLMRMKDEEWHTVMKTNLDSVYYLCKACIRSMLKARFGRIINISSVSGLMGNPGQTNYAASKAGLIGFTKSLAAEVASRNITVNAIAPGFIDTEMTQVLSEEQKKILLDRVPAGRLGLPEEIGAAVAFLASQEAGYITGETLQINGGMYMQ